MATVRVPPSCMLRRTVCRFTTLSITGGIFEGALLPDRPRFRKLVQNFRPELADHRCFRFVLLTTMSTPDREESLLRSLKSSLSGT